MGKNELYVFKSLPDANETDITKARQKVEMKNIVEEYCFIYFP
jgi:hypothetical protein